MNIRNFFGKSEVIGLDVGSSAVKMALFKEAEGGLRLVRAEIKELAEHNDDASFEKEAVSALRYLLKGVGTKKAKFIASINCPSTAIKKVVAPYMPRSELKAGIALEAKSYFPFSIDGSMLDFEILGDVVDKGIRKYDLMVAVCPINTVQNNLSILKKAGVRPFSFVTSSYALGKAAGYAGKEEDLKCFVDIGSSHTEFIIYRDKTIVFTRKIPICGDDFTKSMTDTLVSDRGRTQLTFAEAEKIKKEVGIPADNDTNLIDDKISATQILSMLRPTAENLANEISRCLDYYREESKGARVDNIVLFGGGASLTGLTKFISDSLGLPVRIGDPLEGLKTEKDAIRERERTAHRVELAIGAGLSNAKGINLLPPEIKNEVERTVKRGTIEGIVTAIVIASVLLLMGMNIKIGNFKKRIHVAQLELAALSPQIRQAEARRVADMVLVNEPYWEDVFKELGSLIPEEIKIENLKIENKIIDMKGIVISPDGQQILGSFILSLETGLFNNVKLTESETSADGSAVKFELKCWIDYER
ncbi:MAG: type IV pilus assembly protein PilM [Candidatus Omnitrophota bacterium]|nr:type IV pilus assembly protein PilM [Candidatus Omnitrophota bacterium]